MEDKKVDVKPGDSSCVTGGSKENNFKYADVAVHCSKCGKIHKIDKPEFEAVQTGLFFTINSETRMSIGCPNCEHSLSLVFIERDEPQIEDAKIEQEDKEGIPPIVGEDPMAPEETKEGTDEEVDNKE
jgi:hypothetical protein